LNVGTAVDVGATATTIITGVGVAGATSTATSDSATDNYAGGGNDVVNEIELTLDAHISDSSSLIVAGPVTVEATAHERVAEALSVRLRSAPNCLNNALDLEISRAVRSASIAKRCSVC
jgi:hypothetical protein